MTKTLRFAAALSLIALSGPASAAGDLLVAPTRIILDGARGTEVILNNIGAQPATYRISLELRRMTAAGQLEDVDAAAATSREQTTLAMISYAPRRVVLAPNQPQAIRIGVRPPADLPDGEYRAHMLFRAIPDATAAVAVPTDKKGVSISLTPIYGITIPIIVRKGALQASAAISDVHRCEMDQHGQIGTVHRADTVPSLCLSLARSGDRSTYGRIRVTRAGLSKPLIEARGVAVYAEVSQRTVALPLSVESAAQIAGPVKVEYLEDSDTGGGTIASAQAVIR